MGMVVQHNLPAINSHRQLGINNNSLSKSLEKLSSGFRINRAADDAAGLAISEKMRGQISGLAKASENAQDGISLIQTAEGALQETHSILQRMRELAVQSSNGTYQNEVDRQNINKEVDALKAEIDRISTSTHYNGIQLLDGSLQGARVTTTEGAPRDPNLAPGQIAGVSTNSIVAGTDASFASFEVDFSGLGTGTGHNEALTMKILGQDVTSDTVGANATVATIATKFASKTVLIDGVTYTATQANPTDNFVTFTAATKGASETLKNSSSLKVDSIATANADPTKLTGSFSNANFKNTVVGANFVQKESNITFRDTVKENTIFTINGKNYQVVDKGTTLNDGRVVGNGTMMDNTNTAVVVDFANGDIGAQIASQLQGAMVATAGTTVGGSAGDAGTMKSAGTTTNGQFTVKVNGNTLSIFGAVDDTTTPTANTAAKAPVIDARGPITAATQSIDFQKVEYGMTVKVGDRTYEVVQNGGKVRDDKNVAVVVSDVNNFNSKTVANALFDKLKEDSALVHDYDIKHDTTTSRITLTEKAPKGDTKAVGVEIGNAGATFQIGANGKADQKVSLQVDNMGVANLGVKNKYGATTDSIKDINVGTRNTANEAIEVIDAAINQVSSTRADMGALQNRMEHTIKNLDTAGENLTAAESRIRDVDMAKEMMSFSKSQITSQAAQAMLAQANTLPQGVLQLLQ